MQCMLCIEPTNYLFIGLVYVNLGLPFRLASAPFRTSLPSTFLLAGIASALHFDLVQKPWRTAFFWTSKSSLVCLNSNSVLGKGKNIKIYMEILIFVLFFFYFVLFFCFSPAPSPNSRIRSCTRPLMGTSRVSG